MVNATDRAHVQHCGVRLARQNKSARLHSVQSSFRRVLTLGSVRWMLVNRRGRGRGRETRTTTRMMSQMRESRMQQRPCCRCCPVMEARLARWLVLGVQGAPRSGSGPQRPNVLMGEEGGTARNVTGRRSALISASGAPARNVRDRRSALISARLSSKNLRVP